MRVQTSSSYREILSREKAILENPQIFQNCKYKNNFPLKMAKAHAAAIQNRPLPGIQTPRAVLEWSKREKGR